MKVFSGALSDYWGRRKPLAVLAWAALSLVASGGTAAAGLILAEATCVTPMGVGYPDTPGIWSAGQVDAWKPVTRAVHEAGGCIVMQLWHVGRISHPSLLDGQLPLAPSAIAPKGHVSLIRPETAYVVPHAMTHDEIAEVVALDITDHAAVIAFARRAGIGLVVIGPEAPLVDGLGDSLRSAAIPVFGPSAAAAQLEGSKGFKVTGFAIDYSKCMFCALCVEPCPVDCIFMGATHDLSCYSRDGCIVDYAKLPLETAWGQATLNPTVVAESKVLYEPVWVKGEPSPFQFTAKEE